MPLVKYMLGLCCLCVFCLNFLVAQPDSTRPDYALLWEISGNGLAQPSYVFGSMHVRYEAVFEFPDSLFICLSAVDAFANEVQLDSAMQRIFQVFVGHEELRVDSNYQQLITRKSAKTDSFDRIFALQNPEAFNVRKFLKEQGRYEDLTERGFRHTTLDAYLMEMARNLGKQLYGLEEIDHHLFEPARQFSNARQNSFSLFDNNFEDLLELYYQGDLSPIDRFIRTVPEAFDQLALIPRNYVMVHSMEKIMHEQRLFSVVGAAHLPGPEGVLQILCDEGYTVRRVQPTFTGLRDGFSVEASQRPWPVFTADREAFTFAMPWGVQHTRSSGVQTNYYSFDIGRGLTYQLLISSLLPDDYANLEDKFINNEGFSIEKKEPFELHGLAGHRYELFNYGSDQPHFLGYSFIRNQQLYFLKIGAYGREVLEENPDVVAFLERFAVAPPRPVNWGFITDTLGGFKIRLPDTFSYTLSETSDSEPDELRYSNIQHIYRAGFEPVAASVWLQYFDVEPEAFPVNERVQLQKGVDYLSEIYGIELSVTDRSPYLGLPCWQLAGTYPEQGLNFAGKVIARGNRLYLLSQVDRNKITYTKKFLPSFEVLPTYPSAHWQPQSLAGDEVKMWLPATPVSSTRDARNDQTVPENFRYQIQASDPASGGNVQIDIFAMPDLFGVVDTNLFFEQAFQDFTGPRDSFLQHKLIQLPYPAPVKGQERLFSTNNSGILQRIQVYTQGSWWVRKKAFGTADYLASEGIDRFFNGDKWATDPVASTLFQAPTVRLLAALSSSDTLILKAALKAFDPLQSFKPADFPQLVQLLLHSSQTTNALHDELRQHLMELFSRAGQKGQDSLAECFAQAGTHAVLRVAILKHLGQEREASAYQLFFKLLKSDASFSRQAPSTIFADFAGKPALTLAYWPDFKALWDNDQEPAYCWELIRQVLASRDLDPAPVLAYQSQLVAGGGTRLREARQAGNDAEAGYILQVYALLPAQTNLLLQVHDFFEQSPLDQTKIQAASLLLANGETIPSKSIKAIMRKPDLAIPMVRLLNTYQQLHLLRKKDYDQETIARYLLNEKFIQEEKEGIENIAPKGTLEVVVAGETRRVYLFTFDVDGDQNHLGVVGYFSTADGARAFSDEGWVNYTLYTITSRRRMRKAQQLVDEMQEW
jgi:uncharacterized protein YbaP (TraB family)